MSINFHKNLKKRIDVGKKLITANVQSNDIYIYYNVQTNGIIDVIIIKKREIPL